MFIFLMIVTALTLSIWLLLNRNKRVSFLMEGALFIVFLFLHHNKFCPWYIWLLFYLLLLWSASVTKAPVRSKYAVSPEAERTHAVHVQQGDLTGVYTNDHKVEVYAGIPYAKPPVGDLRWKEPQDPEQYGRLLNADHFAPMAMQKENSLFMNSLTDLLLYKDWKHILHERVRYPMSEDCLYLNIWKPEGRQEKLPVLFYIHGGSLATGQSWWEDYQGQTYAEKGIVFVTFSYRLGAFGFFADEQLQAESAHHTTGMYGFLDQVKALEWIHLNIAAFGGDPDNITIAGESAGSVCVNAFCTSPLTKELFNKAIGESSSVAAKKPAHSFISFKDALAKGSGLKKHFQTDSLEQLRKIPAGKIAQADTAYSTLNALCVDGYALTETPYESYRKHQHHETALLNGYNEHDGDFFTLLAGKIGLSNYRQKIEELYKDQTDAVIGDALPETGRQAGELYRKLFNQYVFAYGHIVWSRLACADEPVYTYIFSKQNKKIGSNHTGELQYAYGNLDVDKRKYSEADYHLSEIMQKYWISFIKTGNPNAEGLPVWDQFAERKMMKLDTNPHSISIPEERLNQSIDLIQ